MDAAWEAAQETYKELSAEHPDFKRIYDSMAAFQKDQNQWMSVSEGPLDGYMQRKMR
jgi:TRAP-type mannitol/chloroaromatic compound transport system substrate-binding protein